MLDAVLQAVLPVLITTFIGFVWVRSGRTIASTELTVLISEVATPCLIVSSFLRTHVTPEAFVALAGGSICAILAFTVIGTIALRLLGMDRRSFLPSLSFPNAGNLGLPLALYAFGQEGLGYAIVFFSVASFANHTLGQAISAGIPNWRSLIRNPILFAVAIGVTLSFTQIPLPNWAVSTINLIGGLTIPLMLLMLGASISQLRITHFWRALVLSAIRIGGGALVGIGVAALFGMTGAMRAALVLQCAMPVAVYNYLYALRWGNRPDEVAGLVVLSTLIAAVTTPLLLAWLMLAP